jgi:hypothetical protein
MRPGVFSELRKITTTSLSTLASPHLLFRVMLDVLDRPVDAQRLGISLRGLAPLAPDVLVLQPGESKYVG